MSSRREKPMHIPLFIDAYLAGTMMLDPEQDGCNLRLMMAAWRQPDCALPHDDRQLATIVRLPLGRWRKISGPVLALWIAENGRLYQRRLRKEWEYVNGKREQTRSAVAARELRKRSDRASSDVSDDASDDVSKTSSDDVSPMVGGERFNGSKYLNHNQEEDVRGVGAEQGRGGFRVIGGGAA